MNGKPKTPQVSLRGETYDLVKKYCDEKGLTTSGLVDELCRAFFERRQPKVVPGGNGRNGDEGDRRLFSDDELDKHGMR